MTKTRILNRLAAAGGFTGIGSFAALHLVMAGTVDLLRDPVSSYALAAPGVTLFAGGALGFAIACAALALRGFGRSVLERVARGLLAVTAVMFTLVVLFPTDSGEAVSSISGQIHRYAAGAAFIGMTLIGFAVSRGRRIMGVLATLSAATLVLTSVNTFLPKLADGGDWRGLPQRILLLVHAVMLVVMALDRTTVPTVVRNETFARFRYVMVAKVRDCQTRVIPAVTLGDRLRCLHPQRTHAATPHRRSHT